MELQDAIAIASSFPETELKPHFEKLSFRVRNKIFATLDESKLQMVIKLTAEQQPDFEAQSSAISAVSGGWGRQGWTTIDLETVPLRLFRTLLTTSYCHVAPKTLAAPYLESDTE
ncbi:MAG: MmcQ/YjbR family DNA-binding protein [Saprospiraceae bacterium]|nr:MmcQ/YjbR family DNA-binding protein [Saprospiraceae bacterium]